MLGKGAKRKRDGNEDGLEGKALAPGETYTLQRQTIFNMSLMKLHSQRAPSEPSLEKRLLINNVLRRIQEELKQEGSLLSPPASSAPVLPRPAPLDSCLTPASLLEDDSVAFCTSPSPHALLPPTPPKLQPPAPKDSFSSALDEIDELCPTASATTTSAHPGVPSHTPPLPTGTDSKDCSKAVELEPAESRLLDPLPAGGLDVSVHASSSFLTDLALDDILFADIDTSMYDFDPCTTTTSGAGGSKMADELVRSLSPYSNGAQTSPSPNQPFKMDLAELDHIMEVLVGS